MKTLACLVALSISTNTFAQNILGLWETYDDKTNEKKAIVEIYESEGKYFAKINKTFTAESDAICDKCKGEKKNQPLHGLVIIENIKKDGNEFNGGTILDPESGSTYKCLLKLVKSNKLKVRGFLGVSLLGRTQYWFRKE